MIHNTTKTTVVARLRQTIVGVNTHLGGVATLLLAGRQFTPASLVQQFQAFVDLVAAIDTAKTKLVEMHGKAKTDGKEVRLLLKALRTFLIAQYGNEATSLLNDFGFAPNKVPAPKPATKVVAAAKNRATRVARHTKGPVQKKAIKGVLTTPVVVDPSTNPVQPAANPAAPQASSAPVQSPNGSAPKAQ
jgi:hypothetical protein